MHYGFTGTRHGMTEQQKATVRNHIGLTVAHRNFDTKNIVAHHGDCVGADDEFHDIITDYGLWRVGHPPSNPKARAWNDFDGLWPEKDYLVRNKDIVDEATFMLATPGDYDYKIRSGTWSTIKYAKLTKTEGIIIFPDGAYTKIDEWQLP